MHGIECKNKKRKKQINTNERVDNGNRRTRYKD